MLFCVEWRCGLGHKQKSELGSPLFVVMVKRVLAVERGTFAYLFVLIGSITVKLPMAVPVAALPDSTVPKKL